MLEPGKTELENLDIKANPFEDIESRLTKLKFFNKTWLTNENVSKIYPVKPHKNDTVFPSYAHEDAVEENEIKLLAAESIKEEVPLEQATKAVEPEPVFSTKEEIDAFNDWY